MEIRAITVGTDVERAGDGLSLDANIPGLLESARSRFADAGLEVQTTRLATQPFPEIVPAERDAVVGYARALETAGMSLGFGYLSMGSARLAELDYAPHLIEGLLATEAVFGTIEVGNRAAGISLRAVTAAATAIEDLGRRSEGGFGNLRFAALANCPPGIPFFPAGYHRGGPTVVGIAWEAADLAVDAFVGAGTIEEAKTRLRHLVEREGAHVAAIGELLAEQHDVAFTGIDLSLAPFPERARSIGEAFERLGVDVFGAPGTLYVAALITDVLQTVNLPRVGYSGLMLPVLEDPVLGRRASERAYSLNELLLYSAVCGLGLDVVPLPGDVSVDQLRGILLDVATLAVRLDKPLTARLMPIPGLGPGDPTTFDFPYFVNTVAMPLTGHSAAKLFAREGL